MNKEIIEAGKSTAITSYILGIGVLIALSMNADTKNPFASFHIRQGLGLTLTFISLGLIISNFDSLLISFPMWIFISSLWSYGIFTAIKGEIKPMPILGNYYQKWLSTIS